MHLGFMYVSLSFIFLISFPSPSSSFCFQVHLPPFHIPVVLFTPSIRSNGIRTNTIPRQTIDVSVRFGFPPVGAKCADGKEEFQFRVRFVFYLPLSTPPMLIQPLPPTELNGLFPSAAPPRWGVLQRAHRNRLRARDADICATNGSREGAQCGCKQHRGGCCCHGCGYNCGCEFHHCTDADTDGGCTGDRGTGGSRCSVCVCGGCAGTAGVGVVRTVRCTDSLYSPLCTLYVQD